MLCCDWKTEYYVEGNVEARGQTMERTKLIAARLRRHWTIAQAAEHLRVGVNTVIRWEKGQRRPFAYNVQRICEVYQAAAWELDLENAHHPDAPEVPANIEEQEAAADALKALVRDDLSLRLLKIVWRWPRSNTRYGELQAHIIQKTEDYTTVNQKNDHSINRRDALRLLALLPIEMCGLSALGPVLKYPAEEILTHCAAGITACWYLRQGKELALASSAVTSYIPTLKSITTSSSASQRTAAADLLVQCFLLKSYLAHHVDGSNEAIYYAQQAEKYGEMVGNTTHQILALRTLASVHDYANHNKLALQVAEKAQYLLEHAQGIYIPKLVHSYVYAGIATYQAHNGRKEQAFTTLNKAHSTFFSQAVDEQVPIWVNHSHANLLLNDGMTHFHLGSQKEALKAFAQIQNLEQDAIGRIEVLVDEVMSEVNRDDKARDMEWCINHWTKGIEGAKALQSEQRFQEALLAYAAMRAAWPGEKAIKDLRELIVHW
jgi:transcriptional regulator with XRE-family HTH domain